MTASSPWRLARIEALTRSLEAVAALIYELERGMLIRDLAAADRERWGLVYAALSDAQDGGAPGTVAGVLGALQAAMREQSDTGDREQRPTR